MGSGAVPGVDPDVDLHVDEQRLELAARPWPVLGAVSAGGAAGALARYAVAVRWPAGAAGFPWSTLAVNVSGCALVAVMMVLITEVCKAPPLARPFLVTGLLGGYTTFSSYAVDVLRLVEGGHPGTALGYLAGTLAAALAAVWAVAGATRALAGRRR